MTPFKLGHQPIRRPLLGFSGDLLPETATSTAIQDTPVMNSSAVRHSGPSDRETGATWNRATFDELRVLLGDDRAECILSSFWMDLCRKFENADDRELLRRDAHIVKSTAGMLGFERLAEAARSLEAACLEGSPSGATAEAVDLRRKDVGEALAVHRLAR